GNIYHIVLLPVGTPDASNYVNPNTGAPFNERWIGSSRTNDNRNVLFDNADGRGWRVMNREPIYTLGSGWSIEGNPYYTMSFDNVQGTYFYGETFVPTSSLKAMAVELFVRKRGSPVDNLYVVIYNKTTHQLVAEVSKAPNEIGTTFGWVRFDFPALVNLNAGDNYRLYLKSPGSSLGNDYQICRLYNYTSMPFPLATWDGQRSYYEYSTNSGSSWSTRFNLSDDLSFRFVCAYPYDVDIVMSPVGRSGRAGTTLTYTVYVINTGSENDNYSLTVTDTLNWGPTIFPQELAVPAGENRTATLSVTIPENAAMGVVNVMTVTATSPNITASENAYAATPGVWTIASYSPRILDYAVAVVGAGENIYIANSDTAVPTTNLFMRYNTSTGEWSYLSTPPEAFKNGTCLAWDNGNYIYALLGGSYEDINDKARHFFYRYSISTNTWTKLENTPDAGGQGAGDAITWVPGSALGVDDNYIYAIVGSHIHGTSFWRYSIRNNAWESVPFHPGWTYTDDGASLVWAGGEYLYALAGEYLEASPRQDFARFRLTDNTWENLMSIPEPGGIGDGASLLWAGGNFANYIYALGGGSVWEEPGENFYAYKIAERVWTTLADLPAGITDQNGPRLGFAGGNIYAWRGYAGDPVLWVYTPIEAPNEIEVLPTDDAEVVQGWPDNNFGVPPRDDYWRIGIRSKSVSRYNIRSFLKFDLSLLPPDAVVTGAKLYLYCYSVGGYLPGVTDVQVREVANDSWLENEITWNNMPAMGSVLDTVAATVAYKWYSWDVTNFVKSQVSAGDRIISLGLRAVTESYDATDRYVYFRSKDTTADRNFPYLEVTYELAACGVEVWAEPRYRRGPPGTWLTYTIYVRNKGNIVDNFALSFIPNGWENIYIDPPVLENVAPSETRQATLRVFVQYDAPICENKEIVIVAESQFCHAVDNDVVIAHAVEVPPYGVEVSISPPARSGRPGATLTYEVTVANTGSVEDTYSLSFEQTLGWQVSLDDASLTVPAGESRSTTLRVTVPSGAAPCTSNLVTVTATSTG
ncbi:MAG: DNRLRE domain-containing protein, partial [Hadesarchaea archaeon]|nr:DNRLRE domain-containing protein [Hadesarchaea archaeon]